MADEHLILIIRQLDLSLLTICYKWKPEQTGVQLNSCIIVVY